MGKSYSCRGSCILEGGTMWSDSVVVIEHLWHHPLLLAFWTCGEHTGLWNWTSPGHRHCQGWTIKRQDCLLGKQSPQQGLEGWSMLSLIGGRERKGKAGSIPVGSKSRRSTYLFIHYSFICSFTTCAPGPVGGTWIEEWVRQTWWKPIRHCNKTWQALQQEKTGL